MLGLVSYDSDEDGEQQQVEEEKASIPQPQQPIQGAKPAAAKLPPEPVEVPLRDRHSSLRATVEDEKAKVTIPHSPFRSEFSLPAPGPALTPSPQPELDTTSFPVGPSLPPQSSATSPYPTSLSPSPAPPGSPYSHTRAQIHTLTLPHTIPPIPPSPPGTPPPHTSSKFHIFLSLKRAGTHFNQKLSQSSSLRNPRLLEKLMGFVGISTEIGDPEIGGKEWSPEQYVSGLDKSIWDYSAWGHDSYRAGFIEELRKSQTEVLEKHQRGIEEDRARGVVRDRVGFVGEKGTEFGSGSGSTRSGAGAAGRAGMQSKAERVMAGLDQPSPASARGENGGAGKRGGYDRNRTQPRARDDRRGGGGGGSGGGGDDYYRNRTREWDRRNINRSRSRSRSKDRDRNRERERERERYRR
ncbi:HCNGP-like protein-domain-containing protein [Tirmania nivea]|nr:HCNGP-like protein-domain-containing protein [Tirmania nivea]